MSEQDSFINEVSEEVRRDRLYALMRRYGWIAALLIVIAVGGASFNEWRKASARADAQATGDAILAALENEDPASRVTALEEIDASDNAGQRALLALIRAAAMEQTDDRAGALQTLDALAADPEVPQTYRDLASLKATILGATDIAPQERIDRLNGLAIAGGAYRLLALEQIALAEVEMGETDAAKETLVTILGDAEVSQSLRGRATQLMVALGGSLADS